jgi:hypothetical protein
LLVQPPSVLYHPILIAFTTILASHPELLAFPFRFSIYDKIDS